MVWFGLILLVVGRWSFGKGGGYQMTSEFIHEVTCC